MDRKRFLLILLILAGITLVTASAATPQYSMSAYEGDKTIASVSYTINDQNIVNTDHENMKLTMTVYYALIAGAVICGVLTFLALLILHSISFGKYLALFFLVAFVMMSLFAPVYFMAKWPAALKSDLAPGTDYANDTPFTTFSGDENVLKVGYDTEDLDNLAGEFGISDIDAHSLASMADMRHEWGADTGWYLMIAAGVPGLIGVFLFLMPDMDKPAKKQKIPMKVLKPKKKDNEKKAVKEKNGKIKKSDKTLKETEKSKKPKNDDEIIGKKKE